MNENEKTYGVPVEEQVVFTTEEDQYSPYGLAFESVFLRCVYDKSVQKFNLDIQPGHAICHELERANRNEEIYNIPGFPLSVWLSEAP